jgi:hypothetical protein
LSDPPLSEALQLLLRELTSRFPSEVVDRVWIFAPREIAGRESGLVVLSLTEGPAASATGSAGTIEGAAARTAEATAAGTNEATAGSITEGAAASTTGSASTNEGAPGSTSDRRQLVTWRYEATRERGKLRRVDTIAEQGWAPRDRIPRLIEGVLARLGDAAETPLVEAVGGDPARWNELLLSMGLAPVDPPYEE